jgi:chorismate synthase
VACVCRKVPPALGEPVFDRLEAKLAHAMLSLPATKGFEFGSGFGGTSMRGSAHNDPFAAAEKGNPVSIINTKNHAGGTLGGISSGQDIYFRVAVPPPVQRSTALAGPRLAALAPARALPRL